MIVGCYSLDLYCDVCWEDNSTPYSHRSMFPHNFTGPNQTSATKKARTAGWTVRHATNEREARAVCAWCKKKGRS